MQQQQQHHILQTPPEKEQTTLKLKNFLLKLHLTFAVADVLWEKKTQRH